MISGWGKFCPQSQAAGHELKGRKDFQPQNNTKRARQRGGIDTCKLFKMKIRPNRTKYDSGEYFLWNTYEEFC